ncbi:TPA: type 4a pilus minor pilin PilV [Pseudomonas aeruginosa]|nr:type 4a pilus minor pilin PilV [Pseudomonas aeruginosa]HCF3688646.1 type 4a pilus minor pilin PilV [Pseudomonas aeruginosa]HEK1563452.1 type 4a pilus minor pilin PilV [Pseudomonas aeruginosa]
MLLKSRHRSLRQSGFSMIEVLVALLLISIGVLGMIAMQGKTIQYTADSVERNKAAMLGSNLLESMRASPKALYDVKDQMATQSDFFKAKGSAFPTAPSSCTPLPDAIKDRLGCWAEQVKNELPGAGDLLKSDYYICRSSKPGDCDGKGSMLEIRLAWRGKQGACVNAADSSADTSLCYYTLRVEP